MTSAKFVHESAEVSKEAKLGLNVKVWNNAQIRENACIGDNCILSKNVYIDEGVSVGDRVKIQNNVSIYKGVTVEDDVFLGPAATFTNDLQPRSFNHDWRITETKVGRGCSVGANATIVCGVDLGEYSMVAAGAVVVRSIPAHALVAGNPAKILGAVYRSGRRVLSEHEQEDGVFSSGDGEILRLPDQLRDKVRNG